MTYTYVLRAVHTNEIKIGKSKVPGTRKTQLERLEGPLEELAVFKGDREAQLHLEFTEKRSRGEWFKLDAADIRSIQERADYRWFASIPKPPRVVRKGSTLTFRMSQEESDALRAYAEEQDRTVSDTLRILIRNATSEHLNKEGAA